MSAIANLPPPPPRESVTLQARLQGDKAPPSETFSLPEPQQLTITEGSPLDALPPPGGLPGPVISSDTFLSLLDMGTTDGEEGGSSGGNVSSGSGASLQ